MRILKQKIAKSMENTKMESGAIISKCQNYRYKLWRIWNDEKPKVLFIMHNPSTADHSKDDPTIRRCIAFAKNWGYGGIYVGNIIPYRATNPNDLLGMPLEILSQKENNAHINEMAERCELGILAYGNPVVKINLMSYDEYWNYLKLTKSGNPCHPLYLKSDLKPVPFITEIKDKILNTK